ncbi:hypothetical protein CHH28_05915 [Bacterioplanes sanyensis]|uniref:Uncharacterized protein n=1 Tax=Bacterioplanes sanyensis TaxID=1249553 RepID=A0A222FJ40_9GAMM|nr:hypothetical protein CHH28_05915 [Bacterioplanes sanyensis]
MKSLQKRLAVRISVIMALSWLFALVVAKYLVWHESREIYFNHSKTIAVNLLNSLASNEQFEGGLNGWSQVTRPALL